MADFIAKHWIISIIMTVVLGAIGAGLWETVFKPVLNKFGKLLFIILTFGAKRARDNIYREAARGHHEVPSFIILSFLIAIFIVGLVVPQIIIYTRVYSSEDNQIITECENIEGVDEREECIDNIRKRIKRLFPYLILGSIFFVIMFLYTFNSMNRTNLVVTYFEQCMKICSPYMNKNDILKYHQMFALMNSKESYIEIIEQLSKLAKSNNLNLPKSYV